MQVHDLIKAFENEDIPDDAVVFMEADHGQNKELVNSITVSRTPKNSDEFGDPDAMVWEFANYEDIYDEDSLDEYDATAQVTAVLISY